MSTVRDVGPPPLHTWPRRACAGANPKLFFPDVGGQPAKHTEALAKAFCRVCPALEQCEAYSVPITNLSGIWAGMTANERTRARKKTEEA